MMKMSIWLKAARLKLHILGMLPVFVGSLIASHSTGNFHLSQFILAELIALFVLVTTAFANDYADAETDMINRTFNMFSGGSRVIPDGLISKPQMMNAIVVTFSLSVILSLVLVVFLRGHLIVFLSTLFGLVIGIEYSLPPLRINYRGFGEVFVMFMYSIFASSLDM
jgi:1,4-dihydroxy-2-naphthoate octaprenyltransferase